MNKTTYFQKNVITTLVVLFTFSLSFGQIVFNDDFNRTTVTPGGNPSVNYVTSFTVSDPTASTAPGESRMYEAVTMTDYYLNLTANTGYIQTDPNTYSRGVTQVSAPLSGYSMPFNTTLKSNTNLVTWAFNIRTNRNSNFTNFTTNSLACAVVLTCNNDIFSTQGAVGYAVTYQLNNSTTNLGNAIYLKSFDNSSSLTGNGSLGSTTTATAATNVLIESIPSANTSGNNPFNSAFISVKVTYNPVDDMWSLYVFHPNDSSNPSTEFTNPLSLSSSDLVGSIVDASHVNTPMTHFGFLYKHNSASNTSLNGNQLYFDNYTVGLGTSLNTKSFDYVTTKLYPNPTNNQLTITSKTSFNSVEISNLLGQKIKEIQNTSGETELTVDVSDLQEATYILKLNSAEGINTTKFVKN